VTFVLPLLAQVLAADVPVEYGQEAASELVAAATVRPVSCGPATHGGAPSLWSRIGQSGSTLYCRLIAGGLARLQSDPAEALSMALRAETLRLDDGAATVLRARALAATGSYADAWAAFGVATAKLWQVGGPNALHELGMTALATGHYEEAAAAYRALVPRAALMGDELRRQKVHVEGALAVMHQGERGAAEAVSYLSELRRGSIFPGLGDYVVATFALALDRQGRSAESRGVVAESEGPWGLAATLEASLPEDLANAAAGRTNSSEADESGTNDRGSDLAQAAVVALSVTDLRALVAVLAEEVAPDLALQQWQSCLEAFTESAGPWVAHAENKIKLLRRKNVGW
jgi:hypothetical protein